MNYSQRRRAENEVVFRQRNNAVKDIAKRVLALDKVGLTLQFTCECSNEECQDTIELPIAEYEGARKNNRRFIVKQGHEQPDIENVIAYEGYYMVEKLEQPPATDGKLNKT